ncbi:hypothetical protein JCM8097_002656 [Rhodosporidiobolus ruineniae]
MRSSVALLALLAPYAALASRILAIHDPTTSASSAFDTFWRSLEDQGFDLTVKGVQESAQLLDDRSSSLFDHLILFAPEGKQVPRSLSPQALTHRLSTLSTDLLLVLPPSASDLWRDFAREFELDPDDRGSVVIDHFSFDSSRDDGTHTTLAVSPKDAPSPFVSEQTRNGPPVVYRGAGHAVGRHPLLTNVLHAASTSFSGDADAKGPAEEVKLAGSSVGLVSAFQARNNARVMIVGSSDLFSDAFISQDSQHPTGNLGFARDLAAWTFQQTGQVRVEASKHVLVETGVEGSPTYRVGSELTYSVELATSPDVSTPLTDLQLEFTMLDPHLRIPLLPIRQLSPGRYLYSSTFAVPDRHGVFTLSLDYRRPGLSFVEDKHTVSVVPLRHNEYERFITGAVPYYTGAFSVSVAFAVFVVLWIAQS